MTGLGKDIAEKVIRFVAGQASMPAVPSVFLAIGSGDGEAFVDVSTRIQIAGSLITNGATSTLSSTLNHAAIPAWVAAGMQAYSDVSRQVVGTVRSVSERQIVLVEEASCAIGSGYAITYTAFACNGGEATNSSIIPVAAADADAWALFDAQSGGNMLWRGSLDAVRPAAVAAGAQLILPPGSLKLAITSQKPVRPSDSAAIPAPPAPVEAPRPSAAPAATLSRAPSGRTAVARA